MVTAPFGLGLNVWSTAPSLLMRARLLRKTSPPPTDGWSVVNEPPTRNWPLVRAAIALTGAPALGSKFWSSVPSVLNRAM